MININIPPLRERPEDIILLFKEFIRKLDTGGQYDFDSIDSEILFHLQKYSWPGNVRELQNVVERMWNVANGEYLSSKHLPADIYSFPTELISVEEPGGEMKGKSIKQVREQNKKLKKEWECQEILRLLNAYNWNISKVAREMNVARSTLYAKIEKYRIDR